MLARRFAFLVVLLLVAGRTLVVAQVPSVPVLLSPADQSMDVSILPTLSWNSSDGAGVYNLQIATDPSFGSVALEEQGLATTSYALSAALANTTQYYWRVNAQQGTDVSEWSSSWTFTTIAVPSPPPVPTLVSPADQAIDVPVLTPLTWNASEGAESYALQISSDPGFGSMVFQVEGVVGTSYTLTTALANSTQYYWRVNARKGSEVSNWSSVWAFTTIIALPSPPVPTSPPVNATNVANPPTFVWNAGTRAQTYDLQISLDNSFVTEALVINQTEIQGTSFSVPDRIDGGRKQYWRVRSVNAAGASSWSPSDQGQAFTTILEVPIQVLQYSPENGSTGVSKTAIVAWWNTTDNPPTSWHLQIATDQNFNTIASDNPGLTNTTKIVSLESSTTYYWRVNATNSVGTGPWSEVWQFTTAYAIPSAPTLLSPANAAVDVSQSPQFSWNKGTGAASYDLQVATASTFASPIVNATGIPSTSYTPAVALSVGTLYYWRARSVNPAGNSSWSGVWSFTTLPAVPGAPIASAATNVTASSFTANWQSVTGASGYRLDVSTDAAFSTLLTNYTDKDVPGAVTCAVDGLNPNTPYYYRVRAYNGGGTSGNSNIIQVTTLPNVPAPPTIEPATNISNSGFDAHWGSVAGAAGYKIDVALDLNFESMVANYANKDIPGVIQIAVTGLAGGTRYYYRVRAYNDGGTSASSDAANVLLIPNAPVAGEGTSILDVSFSANWTKSTGATGYCLDVGCDNGFAVFVPGCENAAVGDVDNADVGGLNADSKYYYRVRAYNESGSSTNSEVVLVTTLAAPLPIELASLSVIPNPAGPGVRIDWSTASEIDCYGFFVQRRAARDTSFVDVANGFLPGAGTTSTAQTYSFVDQGLQSAGTFYYRLRQVDRDGKQHLSEEVRVLLTVLGIVETAPMEFRLDQNFPNPFNPETIIRFSVDQTTHARLEVYDICGRCVVTLFDGSADAGRFHYVAFRGMNLSSGVYFYRLVTSKMNSMKRMILVR
ncbi:MAG: fibronectin type III domain-containing protein [Bacteroidota bacterium]